MAGGGYADCTPYLPYTYWVQPDAIIKQIFQDVYDPELYAMILDEYDQMTGAKTWDDMLTHCRNITSINQEDYAIPGGIQAPDFVALNKAFKNAVYFSNWHAIQFYYLYL